MNLTRIARLLAAVALLGAVAVACSDDDDTSADAPADDAPDTVAVELVDYAFVGLPASVPAGTKLTVTNSSAAEMHELVAIRIPDTETRTVAELLQLPEEEADAIFGDTMPATVLLAAPGGPQVDAVGDGTIAEPGRYAVVCFIPTGADPDEFLAAAEGSDGPPEVAGGPPHAMNGMFAELVVE